MSNQKTLRQTDNESGYNKEAIVAQPKPIDVKTTKMMQTLYVGELAQQISFKNEDGVKLTPKQTRIIKEFMTNHTTDKRYTLLFQHIMVSKYFVAASVAYFPKDAHNTVYTTQRKTIYVGPKGGLRKFTCQVGIGSERNVVDIADYYMKADDM